MIFKDKLIEKQKLIRPEIERLLQAAWISQNHSGDLLLFHINGFFNPDLLNFIPQDGKKLNPHVIGPGSEGHSEQAHYKFIHKYRTTHIHELTHAQYLKEFEWAPERSARIDELTEHEETTIQLEMLIYLKFWEADIIIKKLYQFVRALHGEPYDWYFKVAESSRDQDATGTRQDIIRKRIRDRIQRLSPNLYQILKDTYKTQIRNSIAHSNYSFLGRNIHLNNFIKEDPASQLHNIPFDEWVDIFHNTIVFHNEYIRMHNTINRFYAERAYEHNNTVEILITERDGRQYPSYVEYRPEWDDWAFKR